MMNNATNPADNCCDGCTGTANSVTSNATEPSSDPNMPATVPNDVVKGSCEEECCSGENEKSRKRDCGDRACCERKSTPCCDGRKLSLQPHHVCSDSSQLHALTALRFESAKATAAKRPLAIGLELGVLHVQLTKSVPVRSMLRNWLRWSASVELSLPLGRSLAVSPRNSPRRVNVTD
jgi:hypothetical protein